MSLPYRILAVILALAGAFGMGWIKSSQWHAGKEAKAQLAQSEAYREQERLNAQARAKTMDAYTQRIRTEGTAAAAARSDLDRLRNSLSAPASAASSPACEPDRARADRMAKLLAEGAGLVEEGGRLVARLRADRQALIDAR